MTFRKIDAETLYSGIMAVVDREAIKGWDNSQLKYSIGQAGDGLYLEFGVSCGGSLRTIAEKNRGNPTYGFDCWQGLPETWYDGDGNIRHCAGTWGSKPPPNLPKHVQLVDGYFKDSLPKWCREHPDEKIAFVHIDSDIYSSAKTILDCLKDRLDGVIIEFDEIIGWNGWRTGGEFLAFQEFLENNNYDWHWISSDGTERASVRLTKKA